MSRKQRLQHQLNQYGTFQLLSVEDESSHHLVPKGAETHFKIIAVCEQFKGLNRVARHRLINNLLADEFASGLHALSLHLYSPCEWTAQQTVPASPKCEKRKRLR